MIGGGLGPYAPGEWSDDTQMAVVIARVAADRGLRTVDALDAIVTGWVDWLAAGATDVGTQTRQVLGAVAAEEARRAWSAAASASTGLHRRTGRTAGNGSLMRTAPGRARLPRRPGDAHARRTLGLRGRPTTTRSQETRACCGATRSGWPSSTARCPTWSGSSTSCRSPDGSSGPAGSLTPSVVRRPRSRPTATSSPPSKPRGRRSATRSATDPPLVASLGAAVHAGDDTDTVAAIAGALARRGPRGVGPARGLARGRARLARPAGRRPARPRSAGGRRGAADAAAHRSPS